MKNMIKDLTKNTVISIRVLFTLKTINSPKWSSDA